jgi:hypothetical protein
MTVSEAIKQLLAAPYSMGSQHKRKLSVDDSVDPQTKVNKIVENGAKAFDPVKEQSSTVHSNEQQVDVKQKKNTTPIHRGKFKSRWLSKHSSLLKRSKNAQGLLVKYCTRYFHS